MDWKRTVLVTFMAVLVLRSELLWGADDTQALESRRTDDVTEAVKALAALSLVCAGSVTDHHVETGRKPFNENRPLVAVESVFFGDPDTQDFVLDSRSIKLKSGTRYILFAGGHSSCKWVTHTFPDDAGTRKRVQEAIVAYLAETLVAAQQYYLDVDRFLDEAESLVARLLTSIADASPEHPFLGRKAIQQVKMRRVIAPPGVYVRIAGDMKETETTAGRRKIPQGENAVLLWAGIGIDRNGQRRIGAPANLWGDAGYGGALTPHEAGLEPLTTYRQEALGDPSGMFPFHLALETPCVRKGRPELSDTIVAVFHSLWKEYGELCRRPPQNTAAALACLRSLSEKAAAADDARRPHGFLHAVDKAETLRPYRAFQALENEWVSRRMTEAQEKEAIPVLISLLTRKTVVLDQSPVDGPILAAHHVAYSILTKISGKDLPAPVQSEPEGGPRPVVRPEVPQDETNTPERVKERLEVWEKWWREKNSFN